ncbi:hypothetical protein ACFOY2_20800 [Nonomuraea purpurea]|uniref:LPXTG cell wall anchor domain-containing protein n=1 Tax=Nonomuraea purpurea TaxID=1849276 RepID=A0ABV8G9C5_9ACTN
MARARRLAMAGAVTAFVIAGVSLAAGIGTASAQSGPQVPAAVSTCLLRLPLPLPLLCDSSEDSRPGEERPGDFPPSAPEPEDSWSPEPEAPKPEDPWQPAGEDEHKVPRGHPETGGGGLAPQEPVWPFALGGAALLTGAGLAGFAVRRR